MTSRTWIVALCALALGGCGIKEGDVLSAEGVAPGGKADGAGGGGQDKNGNAAGGAVHCWAPGNIAIGFNSELDPLLEAPAEPAVAGAALEREAAFQQAVDDWNLELAAINPALQLVLNGQSVHFASQHGMNVCQDNTRGHAVYRPDYTPANHGAFTSGQIDTENTASTSVDPTGAGSPGWNCNNDAIESIAMDRLAETLTAINANGTNIDEGDITWFTHEDHSCDIVTWSYDIAVLDNQHFDFYSVMLHEIGHFLGLGHLDDMSGTNVMLAFINKGQRFGIGPLEQAELQARYAQGAPCGPAAVVPPPGGGGEQVEPVASCGDLDEACCEGACFDGLYCDEAGYCAAIATE